MKLRLPALLVCLPALLLMAAGPRTLGHCKPAAGRHQDSRRPKLPRHVLPENSRERVQAARKAVPRPPREEDLGRTLPSASAGRMPPRAFSAMTRPDYLQSFKHPERQYSPPS